MLDPVAVSRTGYNKMEGELDRVEDGEVLWRALLKGFYGPFQAQLEAPRPQAQDGRGSHRVRVLAVRNHAWDERVHPDLVQGDAGAPLEGVETAADVGVEEGVFELGLDAGSLAAVENAMAVLGSQQERRGDREARSGSFQLFDAPLDLGIVEESAEQAHRVRTAADTGHGMIRQHSRHLQKLFTRFHPYDTLKITHHLRERVRSDDGTNGIE